MKRGMTTELAEAEVAQVLEWAGITADSEGTQQSLPAPRQADKMLSGRAARRPAFTPGAARRANPTSRKKSKIGI